MEIRSEEFGKTMQGADVRRYTITNAQGISVSVLDYGCTIQRIDIPMPDGQTRDVVLGYDTLRGYEEDSGVYFGAFVGRYANRIKGASFTLDGVTYPLTKNSYENHLHGNYTKQVFDASCTPDGLLLHRVSPDGEDGFPGTLGVDVLYALDDDNNLLLQYKATTDKRTICNFTNHSYFNLNGDGGDVLHHRLQLCADEFTESDQHTAATGRILPVDGTPLDFRTEKEIGQDIHSSYQQIAWCSGYDHNMLTAFHAPGEMVTFATLTGDRSKLRMVCSTTQPGFQLYTGNFIDTSAIGKGGICYPTYGGVCLETQHFPCCPNYAHFPSTVLNPGETYCQKTVYRFEIPKS